MAEVWSVLAVRFPSGGDPGGLRPGRPRLACRLQVLFLLSLRLQAPRRLPARFRTGARTPDTRFRAAPMVIYGVALLAGCMLAGVFIGELLGDWIGVDANVGGVGIAMLLLVLATARLRATGRLRSVSAKGVTFWSAIYIPVVVAMAASQNVVAAVRGGTAAVLAGLLAVILSCALVPVLSRIGGEPPPPLPAAEGEGGVR